MAYPDPYLAAATALGVSAEHCAIIEDSVIGISAGGAADVNVFAYCPADEASLITGRRPRYFPAYATLTRLITRVC